MFIRMFVQLNSVAFAPPNEIIERLRNCLRNEFKPDDNNDIFISLEEASWTQPSWREPNMSSNSLPAVNVPPR